MRVYIAGHEQEHARSEFERAARMLASFGAEVSSPFHPEPFLSDLDAAPGAWTDIRVAHVLGADAVVVLPSHGLTAVDELLARTAGIPVKALDEMLASVGRLQVA